MSSEEGKFNSGNRKVWKPVSNYGSMMTFDKWEQVTNTSEDSASGTLQSECPWRGTNEESKGVRMAFSADGLTITSRAPEMGEAEIKVDLPEYNGEDVEIGFNPAYLLDALKVVDENEVFLEMKAANKPGVLRTGPNFLYVVMPVNLQ